MCALSPIEPDRAPSQEVATVFHRASRRPARGTRPAGLLLALLLPALVACGGEKSVGLGEEMEPGFDAVEITGDFGAAPTVKWNAQMSADETETKTLVEGDGPAIAEGSQAFAYLWLGNGYTKKEAFNGFESGQPEMLTADDKSLSPVFADLLTGAKAGSRVAAVANGSEVFGEAGNPSIGVANQDAVLIVMDVVSPILGKVEGAAKPAPAWAPTIVETDGTITGLDFSKTPRPGKQLQKAVLVEGTGAEVKPDASVLVRYLGQIYKGAKPFDQNFDKAANELQPFSLDGVVKGWKQGLAGQKVGSRVVLSIPPALGYGAEGNADAGIKGTDTLFFVVDILGAS